MGVAIMIKNRDREPLFSISVAARLLGTSPRVLRSYEEANLITPHRTEGNTRLYSEQDIRKLQVISYLHKEKEVNLSGIKIILDIISYQKKYAKFELEEGKKEESEVAGLIRKIMEIAPELLEVHD